MNITNENPDKFTNRNPSKEAALAYFIYQGKFEAGMTSGPMDIWNDLTEYKQKNIRNLVMTIENLKSEIDD